MPMSAHIRRLREAVGPELLMLPGVAALVRDEQGRVLLHRRADDGSWTLPSGAIEPGETPATACERETHEETGLEVRAERVLGVFGWPRLRHRYPNGDLVEYLVVLFRCAVVGGTLGALDGESTELGWFTREQLATMPLPYPIEVFDSGAEVAPLFDR